MKGSCAVIAMYTHVEGYPPSLNAIQRLSSLFDLVVVVHRNTMGDTWVFPSNVKLITTGSLTSFSDVKKKSGLWKSLSFIRFVMLLMRTVRSYRPNWILIHEPIALLALWIVRKSYFGKYYLWYHNHDVIEGHESFLFRLAFKAQNSLFDKLDIFSLPADERKIHFPMNRLNGKYFNLPNYPGVYLYNRYHKPRKIETDIRVIFQGHIGGGHCLEEVIDLLTDHTFPYNLTLVLKGFKDEAYFKKLMDKAKELKVEDKVIYFGVSGYQSVPAVASTCHIGIGIHTKTDVMNSTLGKASNKIYESAALGLPVLLFDNPHFKDHLGKYEWAIFTDGTPQNLKRVILETVAQYERLSLAARQDFLTELNFEKAFQPAYEYVFNLNGFNKDKQ